MKKLIFVFLILMMSFSLISCGKEEGKSDDAAIEKEVDSTIFPIERFSSSRWAVYKSDGLSSVNNNWLATLEKGESVMLLDEYLKNPDDKEDAKVAKIRMSDNREGYMLASQLGIDVIVFTSEINAFVRPTITGATVGEEILPGNIGIVFEENEAGWRRINVRNRPQNTLWSVWVNGGYTTEIEQHLKAFALEREVETATSKWSSEAAKEKALEELKSILMDEDVMGLYYDYAIFIDDALELNVFSSPEDEVVEEDYED